MDQPTTPQHSSQTPPPRPTRMTLDTPARAACATRPQTRAWRRLLVEASADDHNTEEIRAELRRHLEAADRLANKRKVVQPSLHILQTTATDWNERVKALEALRAAPNLFDVDPIAPWLITQLGELRSSVVVSAANAVAAVAAAKLFSAEQAAQLFIGAANGVNISKKVMADARRRAAMTVLHAQGGPLLYDGVVGVTGSLHPATRRLAVDAMMEMLDNAANPDAIRVFVVKLLEKVAIDKNIEVREGARTLKAAYEKRFGEEECSKILDGLSKEAVTRLSGAVNGANAKMTAQSGGSKGAKPGLMSTGKKPNIKDLIRAKREAMKRQKMAEKAGNAEFSKNDLVTRPGKENVVTPVS